MELPAFSQTLEFIRLYGVCRYICTIDIKPCYLEFLRYVIELSPMLYFDMLTQFRITTLIVGGVFTVYKHCLSFFVMSYTMFVV